MTWVDVAPMERKKAVPPGITISSTGGVHGRAARLLLVIRPALIPNLPAWLARPGKIGVQIGKGENQGAMALLAAGTHTLALAKCGRHGGGGSLHLKLPSATANKIKPTAVPFTLAGNVLLLELPAGIEPKTGRVEATPPGAKAAPAAAAKIPATATPPAPPAPPTATNGSGFSMIGDKGRRA